MMLRVLLVSPKPPPYGGIGHWTLMVLRLAEKHPRVIIHHVDISPRWRDIDNLSIPVRIVGGAFQGIFDLVRNLAALVSKPIEVIHLTTSGSLAAFRDIALLLLARLWRVSTVYHLRIGRLPDIVLHGGWEWKAMRVAMRIATRVAVLDAASEQVLTRVFPSGKVIRVPNAISLEEVSTAPPPYPSSCRRVLFLGWIIPTKGISELLEAWQSLKAPGWILEIAGANSQAARKQMLSKTGKDQSIQFLGQLSKPEVWKRLTGCDIFVLPTYTEGFPNVILEAMAAGKAILTTPVGAIPEMLDIDSAEPCGICVPPRDSEALASGLKKLMSDSALRAVLGSRAREKVERAYDINVVFEQWLDVWRSLGSAKTNAAARSNIMRANKEDPKRA